MTSDNSFLRAAIDIGGTTASLAIVSNKGKILLRDKILTGDYASPEQFVSVAVKKLQDMALTYANTDHVPDFTSLSLSDSTPAYTGLIDGIGIGAPCANSTTGEIEAATNLPWPSPIPLRKLFEEMAGVPVAIANDANAAAAGEMLFGNARGMRNFIMLTLGTGVGAGIVCDGVLLNGERGFAGELGHVVFEPDSQRMCACGRPGCLQMYCSADGVVATARQLLAEEFDLKAGAPSTLRRLSTFSPKDISEAALAGDSLANEVWQVTGEHLGHACAQFAAFSDPEAFILFGGVAKAGELLLGPAREAFRQKALHLYRDRVKFLATGLAEADAALLGAAALLKLP